MTDKEKIKERRVDYPELLKRVASIENKVNGGLTAQFNDLKEINRIQWKNHNEEAKEFRNNTLSAFNSITDELKKLYEMIIARPCIQHTEKMNQYDKERDGNRIWVRTLVIVFAISFVTGLITWGSMKTRVDWCSHKWEQLESKKAFIWEHDDHGNHLNKIK